MRSLPLLAAGLLLAAFTDAPLPQQPQPLLPIPLQSPVQTPAAPAITAPVPAGDWRDWPVSPGTWDYRQDARGSIALFGVPGLDAELTLRCDAGRRMLYLSRRAGAQAGAPIALTIRTSDQRRTLSAQPTGTTYVAVELAPRDMILDSIGYSRGRFLVETPGLPVLVVPAWAEILRVAEDCR